VWVEKKPGIAERPKIFSLLQWSKGRGRGRSLWERGEHAGVEHHRGAQPAQEGAGEGRLAHAPRHRQRLVLAQPQYHQ